MAQVAALEPGLVDTLAAPAPGSSWPQVARTAAALAELLEGAADPRERWIAAQSRALHALAEVRAGAALPWAAQVERCLQVQPQVAPVARYAAAHEELAALLPRGGSLLQRWTAFRAATLVPAPRVPGAFRAALDLLRPLAGPLPAGESVQVHLGPVGTVGALTRPLSAQRSAVVLEDGRPLPLAALVALAAHEGYPGHHVERVRRTGLPERAVAVVGTPETVVSEGLAECALRASGLQLSACGAVAVGLAVDLAHVEAVAAAAAPLARAKTDAAVLLHTRGAAAAAAHLERWGLHDPARVRAQLAFLADRRWSVHAVAYGVGAERVGAWLDGGGSFAELHARPVLPQDLLS